MFGARLVDTIALKPFHSQRFPLTYDSSNRMRTFDLLAIAALADRVATHHPGSSKARVSATRERNVVEKFYRIEMAIA